MSDLTPSQRGWGPGPGPKDSEQEKRYLTDHTTVIIAGGVKLRCRKEVAYLFQEFINELTGPTYRYVLNVRADDWGYANRDVRGAPGTPSNHKWGLAIDLNATTNPMTKDGRVHTDLPRNIQQLAAKYGLRWGGAYTGSRKDPMHFEYMGTPEQCQDTIARVKAGKTHKAETHPKSKYPVPHRFLHLTDPMMHGDDVKWLQEKLKIHIDGFFGRDTRDALKSFQHHVGLTQTGELGQTTLNEILRLNPS